MTKSLTSPRALFTEAKQQMLSGRNPQSRVEWILVMNFMAFSIERKSASRVCKFLRELFDVPLSEPEVEAIVHFQNDRKGGTK